MEEKEMTFDEKRAAFLKEMHEKAVIEKEESEGSTDSDEIVGMIEKFFSLPAADESGKKINVEVKEQAYQIAKKCMSAGPSALESYAWRQSASELYIDLAQKWIGCGTDAERELLARIYIPILDAKLRSEGKK